MMVGVWGAWMIRIVHYKHCKQVEEFSDRMYYNKNIEIIFG